MAVLIRIFWPRTRGPICRGRGRPRKPILSGASAQRDVFAGAASREVAVPVRTQARVLVGGTGVLAKNSRNHRVSLLLVTPGKSLRGEPEGPQQSLTLMGLQPPEPGENEFLLSEPPNRGHPLTAAPTDRDSFPLFPKTFLIPDPLLF